jgi:large subunit ribosomal protein L15
VAEDPDKTTVDPENVRLERLGPAPRSTRARRRVGRGEGSGRGKTSGRGTKGLGARSGGGVRPGFTGGQMPLYMQQGKLRGANKKMSMPMGPFRTHTVPVNVGSLAAFPAGSLVDEEALVGAGLVRNNANRGWPVKILGDGDLAVALTVCAHAFSTSARAKIEAAGGTVELVAAPAGEEPSPEAVSTPEPDEQPSADAEHGAQDPSESAEAEAPPDDDADEVAPAD